MKSFDYDLAIIGIGFAGAEAAWAAAKLGMDVLAVSTTLDWKHFPCSTGLGGPGRGHILREISAMGGLIPEVSDRNYIHRRPSNYSKGPAVSSLFYLVDEIQFSGEIKSALERRNNIHLYQGRLDGFYLDGDGFLLNFADGTKFRTRSLVIAAGTFINGKVIQGKSIEEGGRKGLYGSKKLYETFKELGFKTATFRTGTPPRISASTFNKEKFEVQKFFKSLPFGFDSFKTPQERRQIYSYAGHTNEETKKETLKYLSEVEGLYDVRGPGHCPSFVDKVLNYPLKDRHQIFIFPTSTVGGELIISGLGLPFSVEAQLKIIRTIEGLEEAEIVRPGYAVEYDFIYPTQLKKTLESKAIENL
ncbi:MAG: FAD-dependent oxidoreductase, partial [Actinobacteria bacterium]|nr:FAD-dependent oxidoreductase [Actinomycetota bacterium]